jgi:hypothetical protein
MRLNFPIKLCSVRRELKGLEGLFGSERLEEAKIRLLIEIQKGGF